MTPNHPHKRIFWLHMLIAAFAVIVGPGVQAAKAFHETGCLQLADNFIQHVFRHCEASCYVSRIIYPITLASSGFASGKVAR